MDISSLNNYFELYGGMAIFIVVLLEYMNLPGFPAGIIMPLAGIYRQKRIEQGDTECHGHNINQIVLHRPLCIFENKFSVHRSCPLPSW